MICEKCGDEIPKGRNICKSCGTKVNNRRESGRGTMVILILLIVFVLILLGLYFGIL